MKLRAVIRTLLILAFAVAMAAQQVSDMLLPWRPFGTYGFGATTLGTVTVVRAGSPAALAGIEPGDRVDISNLTYHQRRRLIYLSIAPPGETLTLALHHHGIARSVTLTSVVYTRSSAENVSDVVETFERIVLIAIAVFLALSRPSLLTFSFCCIAFGTGSGASLNAWLSDGQMRVDSILTNAAIIAGACGQVVFAMMFPRPAVTQNIVRATVGLAFLGILWWGVDIATTTEISFLWSTTTDPATLAFLFRLNGLLPGILDAAAIIAFVINYTRSPVSDRIRMQWVTLGFAIGSVSTVVTPIFVVITGFQPALWVQNAVLTLNIFIPVTVAYAILKHHIVDVRFFLSRALVYSAITGIAVVFLGLLEELVSKQLEAYHLALAVEVAGALVIGIGMSRIHKTIDGLVDRFVFRSVYVAETYLANVGEAMMFARSADQVDALLCEEPVRALDLSEVRVVREICENDRLALRLSAARTTLDEESDVAIPFIIRHQLYGYARFGPHRNGAAIDPNERSILVKLCGRAALAYDHLTSEDRAAENERLRLEIDVLKARNDELRNMSRA